MKTSQHIVGACLFYVRSGCGVWNECETGGDVKVVSGGRRYCSAKTYVDWPFGVCRDWTFLRS